MKKILEVLQNGEGELKFNTDLNVQKDPMAIMDLTVRAMFSMATKLWGGNEQTVIAVIRSLFVADMAISIDRKTVLKGLGIEAEKMGFRTAVVPQGNLKRNQQYPIEVRGVSHVSEALRVILGGA